MSQATVIKSNSARDNSNQFNGPVVNLDLRGKDITKAMMAFGLEAETKSSKTSGPQKFIGVADSLVSFGENGSYFLGYTIGGKEKKRLAKLPQDVKSHLLGKKNIVQLRCLSLRFGRDFFMTCDMKDGGVSYFYSFNDDMLEGWLNEEPKKNRDLRVVFGPGNSWLAWQPGKVTRWRNIPKTLEAAIKKRKVPSLVALGANGAYIATWPSGTPEWSSLGNHPGLTKALNEEHEEIVFVALSPYNSFYYIQFANGKVYYSAPWDKLG